VAGNGSSSDEVHAAVPLVVGSDPLSIVVDKQAMALGLAHSGDPIYPSRVYAGSNHDPNDHPSVGVH
jgi:hypothetical protein